MTALKVLGALATCAAVCLGFAFVAYSQAMESFEDIDWGDDDG